MMSINKYLTKNTMKMLTIKKREEEWRNLKFLRVSSHGGPLSGVPIFYGSTLVCMVPALGRVQNRVL
jgi:hypothetical protein